jgi:hypothetical protein
VQRVYDRQENGPGGHDAQECDLYSSPKIGNMSRASKERERQAMKPAWCWRRRVTKFNQCGGIRAERSKHEDKNDES